MKQTENLGSMFKMVGAIKWANTQTEDANQTVYCGI